MNKVNFFNGIVPTAENLNDLQEYVSNDVESRSFDILKKGILLEAKSSSGMALSAPYVYTDGSSLGLYGLVAYNNIGQRIYIEPTFSGSTKIPTVSGLKLSGNELVTSGSNIPSNSTYTMVLRYYSQLSTEKTQEQYTTKLILPILKKDSYRLYLREENVVLDGDIVLATITTNSEGVITVDETVRDICVVSGSKVKAELLNPNKAVGDDTDTSNISFDEHLNMQGTGTWSNRNPHGMSASDLGIDTGALIDHQLFLHSDGIVAKDTKTTTSALYPSLSTSSLTSEEKVIIQPLNSNNGEIVVVNGKTLSPASFSSVTTIDFSLLTSSSYIGYHIIAIDYITSGIVRLGPFPSETGNDFLAILGSRQYLPICSVYWGLSDNDILTSYDLLSSSLKDLRVFGTVNSNNLRGEFANALRDGAPIATGDMSMFFARCTAKNKSNYYDVVSNSDTFQVTVNGNSYPFYTFVGTSALSIGQIVDQLNTYFDTNAVADAQGNILPARAIVDSFGYLAILAPSSLKIGNGSANDIFGFSSELGNLEDSGDSLKVVISTGEYTSVEELFYDTEDNLSQVQYTLQGNTKRTHTLVYSGDNLVQVKEQVN